MKTKQKILKAILHNGAMSRTELSAELNVSTSRISEVTGAMIEEGLLITSGYGGGNSRGRKNVLLDINVCGRFALGIGLCRKVICAGITTVKGETIESRSMNISENASPDEINAAADKLCRDIIENCCLKPEQLLGIGICRDKAMGIALNDNESAAKHTAYSLPVLIEPADEYLEYSSAYIPIDPTEMYMFGCAKIIRDVFLGGV